MSAFQRAEQSRSPQGCQPCKVLVSLGLCKLEQNPKIKYADQDKLGKAELLAWLRGPQANLTEKLSSKHSLAERLSRVV